MVGTSATRRRRLRTSRMCFFMSRVVRMILSGPLGLRTVRRVDLLAGRLAGRLLLEIRVFLPVDFPAGRLLAFFPVDFFLPAFFLTGRFFAFVFPLFLADFPGGFLPLRVVFREREAVFFRAMTDIPSGASHRAGYGFPGFVPRRARKSQGYSGILEQSHPAHPLVDLCPCGKMAYNRSGPWGEKGRLCAVMARRIVLIVLLFLPAGPWQLGCEAQREGFPSGFLWGVSTAGFPHENGCPGMPTPRCTDTGSDWYRFVTAEETVGSSRTHLSGEDPAVAGPGLWELYPDDLERAAQELGSNAMRMSIEWSRIFPEPTDGIEGFEALRAAADPAAVEHYHEVLAMMRRRGLEPLVVINHYTLPAWLHDAVGCHQGLGSCARRGWLDRERAASEAGKYAGFVAAEYGQRVDWWVTVHNPFQVMFSGYIWPAAEKSHPPAALLAFTEAKQVLGALVEAHAHMARAVRAGDQADADGDGRPAMIGTSCVVSPVHPADPDDPRDRLAADNVFYLWNTLFLDAMIRGDLDAAMDGEQAHRADLDVQVDFVGLNYFRNIVVTGTDRAVFPGLSPLTTFDPLAFTGGDDPEGFYEMIMHLEGRYGLPVVVTENGTDDRRDDGRAPAYLVEHLIRLRRAIGDGADVRGYFYANLLDGFDWNRGTSPRFGLYAVEPGDPGKNRTPRRAASTYAAITAAGDIPEDLLNRYVDE